jgi:RHS repeat-associated protein
MEAAAQEQVFRGSLSDPCVFFPLAAFEGVGKNLRLGFARKNLALHQGSAWSNSARALGIDGALLQVHVGSRYTSKERDAESGLDNFGARYMASTMGRFMSADPFTVTPGRVVDPQQLNLYAYVRNNPLKHIDPTGMLIDDAACKQDMKHCGKDWQKVQDIANQQDKNGNYLHPELHNELTTLQNDSRTFTIENSSLGAGTAGQFTITNFTADGKDFTRATLQLDFKQIKGISGVTGADLVPGFNKYQGLLDSPMYRLAETFGHEAGHGLFSIQNPGQAVGIQQLLNQRDASMQGQHYPYPPDVMQKMQQADQALIPTERFAQQVEKIVNGELQADKKKQ